MIPGLFITGILLLLTACTGDYHYAPVREGTVTSQLAPQQEGTHVVQPGESLYSIAWRYQRDFRELATINNIPEPYVIQPGQIIQLQGNDVHSNPVIVAETEFIAAAPAQVPSENTIQTETVEPTKPDNNPSTVNQTSVSAEPTIQIKSETSASPAQSSESTTVIAVSAATGSAKWIWPAEGKVIRGFSSKNKGLDIQGKENSPVFATAAGQIVYSGTGLRGYGQLVIIKHNADYLSAYAHNNRILVTEGQQVNQGQHIADMGDTGTNTVKLHFELRYKGKPVDPIKYLPTR